MSAVEGLDVEVVIAAASPWSKWADSSAGAQPPANVDIRRLGFVDLRQLYADAAFVVMPLMDVDFQAGITTILEAMAMARAVVCTRTPGQTDTIVDGCSGVYVPPGDVGALRQAITTLLDDAPEAERLGEGGRRWVEEHATVEMLRGAPGPSGERAAPTGETARLGVLGAGRGPDATPARGWPVRVPPRQAGEARSRRPSPPRA